MSSATISGISVPSSQISSVPSDPFPLLPDDDLFLPGRSTNADYIRIMGARAKLFQTAKKINKITYNVSFRFEEEGKPFQRTTTQSEYCVVTAEGEKRWFFGQPESIFCKQKGDIFVVHRHYTASGKCVHVPQDYLTNPKYRSPSPLPDAPSKSIESQGGPSRCIDTSKVIKSKYAPDSPLAYTPPVICLEDAFPPASPVDNFKKYGVNSPSGQSCIIL